jgi:serine/threonine-protein kinase
MAIDKIGQYQIRSELGRGGMATVYEAWDPTFDRKVALKVLPDELLHDGTFRQRFEREAKTIAGLEHPAIVPVYEYGEADNKVFLAMRYMGGGSLADKLRANRLSASGIARIYDRVAPALDLAHGKGVIHRDLKPGNILFDDNGEPYVSDFGIAKLAISSNTELTHGGVIGTPSYMSPEQARGERLDGRSDIYAMGVMLFELLAGSLPYRSETPTGLMMKHILDPIPRLEAVAPGLPGAWQAVIDRAMAKRPEDRYANMASLANDLRAIAEGRSMTSTPPMESPNPVLMAGAPMTQVYGSPGYGQTQMDATSVMGAPPAARGAPMAARGTPPRPMLAQGAMAMSMPASQAPPPAVPVHRSRTSPLLIVLGILGAVMLCGGGVAALSASGALGGSSPATPALAAAASATVQPAAPPTTAPVVVPTTIPVVLPTSAPAVLPTTVAVVLPTTTPIPAATTAPPTPTTAPTLTPAPTETRGPTATAVATSGPSCATGTAAITSPTNGQVLKGNVAVTGSAICDGFEYYKFEFVDSRCGATGLCFVAGKFLKPVTNGALMTWDTTRTYDGAKLPNGTYVLRLTVVGVGRPGFTNLLPNKPQITVVINN